MIEWIFIIKQDGITVARGSGTNKEFVISEAEHYFSQYTDDAYTKITLEIKKKKDKEQ